VQRTAARQIRVLPPLLVNQIAAGEVVERPASVVKELVENSLDAGATRIAVDLEQGGVELIRVSDDGHGVGADQLALAVAPHATSKITEPGDLIRIGTLGFRGEALASIASVSRMTVRSRTAGDDAAAEIDAEGDFVSVARPAAGPGGTSVTVRNLFFNTPARRKFLRTAATEQARCLDVVRDLAMAHPAVGFTATCDGRRALDLPPGQSARERALAVLGPELAEQLLEVHADGLDGGGAAGLVIWGLAGVPAIARATNQAQHVFLNGRAIRDKTIQHAIKEAYRGLIEPGRHPTALLMLEMDPASVDVNVHPAKAEVRFRDQSLVHSGVLRAVRDALRAADLTPTFEVARGPGFGGDGRAILPTNGGWHGSQPVERRPPNAAAFIDYFKRQVPAGDQGRISYEEIRRAMEGVAPALSQGDPGAPLPPVPDVESRPLPVPLPAQRILQVHNSYVVTQDEQGVVIIDQHALHERVMFEALVARVSAGGGALETQRLLTPAVVNASPERIDRLKELAPLLARIGVEAEPMGPGSVAIHAFPSFLFERGVDPVEFLTDLFEKSGAEGFAPEGEQALHEVLDMMACKAAVKAGDRMSEGELEELLKLRDEVERSSNCPHGRPTSVRLTIRELERLFKRS
jgi:DNA mismatch repair protein MutL